VNIHNHESVHRRRANASRAVGGYIHNRPRRCSRDRLLSIHEDADGRTVSDIATRWCDEEKNGPFWIKSASSCRRYPSLWTTPVPIRDAPSCTQSPSVLPCKNTLLFRNTRNLFIIPATPNTINYTRSSIHSGSAESSSAEVELTVTESRVLWSFQDDSRSMIWSSSRGNEEEKELFLTLMLYRSVSTNLSSLVYVKKSIYDLCYIVLLEVCSFKCRI